MTHLPRTEISMLSCPSPCARNRTLPRDFSPSPIRAAVSCDRAQGCRRGPSSEQLDGGGAGSGGGAATSQAVPLSSRVGCTCVRVRVHFVSLLFNIYFTPEGVCTLVFYYSYSLSVNFKVCLSTLSTSKQVQSIVL